MNKRPLSEISEVKDILLRKYLQLLSSPMRIDHKSAKEDLKVMMLYKVIHMPYWMVQELDSMDFDIDEQQETLF